MESKLLTTNPTRTFFIDSGFRNRDTYKNPSSFTIPFTSGNEQSGASDPIVDAVPYANGLTASAIIAGVTTVVDLGAGASNVPNFYNGHILDLGFPLASQMVSITSYSGATHLATFSPTFPVGFPIGSGWQIRRALPVVINQVLLAAGSQTTAVLQPSSPVSVGNYIRFTTGANAGQLKRITGVVGNTVTFGAVPATTALGDSYEILLFTRGNAKGLYYGGGLGTDTQAVLHEIELLHLVIPNVVVSSGGGGNLRDHSYLLVEFHNDGQYAGNSFIYSNNPHTKTATFVIPNDDDESQAPGTKFLRLTNSKKTQVIKFKPTANIAFCVRHVTGEPIVVDDINFPANAESFSPFPPNPDIQFRAVFEIKRCLG